MKTDNDKPQILSEELKIVFSQDGDGNDENREDGQFLELRTDSCGGGDYFILSTERWAYDNLEELIETLKQFHERYKRLNAK